MSSRNAGFGGFALVFAVYMIATSYLVISTIGETDTEVLKSIARQQVAYNALAALLFAAVALAVMM